MGSRSRAAGFSGLMRIGFVLIIWANILQTLILISPTNAQFLLPKVWPVVLVGFIFLLTAGILCTILIGAGEFVQCRDVTIATVVCGYLAGVLILAAVIVQGVKYEILMAPFASFFMVGACLLVLIGSTFLALELSGQIRVQSPRPVCESMMPLAPKERPTLEHDPKYYMRYFLPRKVHLKKSQDGGNLGFNIRGGRKNQKGMYISKVMEGSEADNLGLQAGDQIISVNGTDFQNISHDSAVQLLKNASEVDMTVKFYPNGLKKTYACQPSPRPSPRPEHHSATFSYEDQRHSSSSQRFSSSLQPPEVRHSSNLQPPDYPEVQRHSGTHLMAQDEHQI